MSNSESSYVVTFAAPAGQSLTTGTYEDAQSLSNRSPADPGIDVSGGDVACATELGSFSVYDATYDGEGNILSFAVQFSVHCDAETAPPLDGFVSYQSSVTLPTWIVPSSSSVDFGPTRVGRLSDQDLIWTNLGGANEITGFTFSGSDANDWSVIFSTCEVTLGPGQDCNLSLSFIPSAPGPRQATVTLVDSESPTAVVSLSGVGTVGYYTVDPAAT